MKLGVLAEELGEEVVGSEKLVLPEILCSLYRQRFIVIPSLAYYPSIPCPDQRYNILVDDFRNEERGEQERKTS